MFFEGLAGRAYLTPTLDSMNEALAMVARVAEAQKAGESNPEAMAELQESGNEWY